MYFSPKAVLQLCGYLAAFSTAMLVIILDCNSALRVALKRAPINILKSSAVWLLAIACGAIAALCFHFSSSAFLTQIIVLKWDYPPGRGFLVGIAVLTIVRSKFFNFKDTEIGGEFFYNAGRARALNAIWQKWRRFKDAYTTPEKIKAALKNPTFEEEVTVAIEETIALQPEEFKKWVRQQIDNIQRSRPNTPTDPDDPKWKLYFRTLIKLALDCGGTEVFSGIAGFA